MNWLLDEAFEFWALICEAYLPLAYLRGLLEYDPIADYRDCLVGVTLALSLALNALSRVIRHELAHAIACVGCEYLGHLALLLIVGVPYVLQLRAIFWLSRGCVRKALAFIAALFLLKKAPFLLHLMCPAGRVMGLIESFPSSEKVVEITAMTVLPRSKTGMIEAGLAALSSSFDLWAIACTSLVAWVNWHRIERWAHGIMGALGM